MIHHGAFLLSLYVGHALACRDSINLNLFVVYALACVDESAITPFTPNAPAYEAEPLHQSLLYSLGE